MLQEPLGNAIHGAFMLSVVKKLFKPALPLCRSFRASTSSGKRPVFTASMKYGGHSENTLKATFVGGVFH